MCGQPLGGAVRRYYAQQRITDAASAAMAKDEGKRLAREARERDAERQLLSDLFAVGVGEGAELCGGVVWKTTGQQNAAKPLQKCLSRWSPRDAHAVRM
jgi:hypothetical protein